MPFMGVGLGNCDPPLNPELMRPSRSLLAYALALAVPLCTWAQTESEPNDDFAQADVITLNNTMNGDMGPAPCASGVSDDYFSLNLTEDGSLNFNTNAANFSAGSQTLRIYVYNAGGGQIAYFDHSTGPNGIPMNINSVLSCVNKGLYYVRLNRLGAACFSYGLTVSRTAPTYADDLEPNNNFAEAQLNPVLPANTFTEGHVNFLYDNAENDDYYLIQTGEDGRLNITFGAEGANGGTVRVYVYNGGGGQVNYVDFPVGGALNPITTTQSFTCYGQGAYYLRATSISGCGVSYRIRYTMTPPVYGSDAEPNNEFAAALPLAHNTYAQGHLNFNHYGDNEDYYAFNAPLEGTITVTLVGEHAGTVAGTVRTYLYNSGGGQIDYFDGSVGANSDDDTTVASFTCYGQGAYYLRTVSIGGCGISYKVKYAMTGAVYANDAEPNNTFGQAAANPLLAPSTFTEGHINFNHYGDNDDYYYINTPAEGSLRLTTIAERVPGTAGTVRVYVYNNGGGQVDYYDASVGGNNDDDTTFAQFDCYGQGNYYIRVVSNSGCGISYKLKYDLLPAVYGSDTEPNDDFAQAAANPLLGHNVFTDGHVNFIHYGDNNDYYYIQTPDDGDLRLTVMAERVPAVAGTLRVYVYNNSGGQIFYYDASVGAANDDDTTVAVATCYGQGNYYLRVTSINGCGISYRMKYEILAPVYGNDPEPNNSFAEAVPVNPDSSSANGHLNFAYTGNNDDYAKVVLPANGNISFNLGAENAGGGTIRTYLYNVNGGQMAYQDVPVGSGHTPVQTTVAFNGLAAGTYYIRLTSINGCGISYRLNCNDADGDGTCNFFDLCPGGPEPGTACDDSDPNTTGDVIDASCNCVGTPVSCDDGDPCTVDTWNGTTCVYTFQDADFDGTCDANDGCPNDGSKTAPGVCGCGNPDVPTTWYADVDGDGLGDPFDLQPGYTCDQPPGYVANASDFCPATDGTVGSACDDGDPNTTGDVLDGNCNCMGSVVNCHDGDPCTLDTWNGTNCVFVFQDADTDGVCDANDGCPNDPGKTDPGACGCGITDVDNDQDGIVDCNDSCPSQAGQIGDACDDGDPNTEGDVVGLDCQCAGTPVSGCTEETLVLTIALDDFGSQTTWELRTAPGNNVVGSGGPYTDGTAGTVITEAICVPAGCYRFGVHDANGDGMGQGGYVVSDGNGNRIIDANGNFGALSYMGAKFCLPVGPVELLPTSCDRTDLTLNDQLVTTTVAGATAYQFAFFDPHGSYLQNFTRSVNMIGPAPNADFPLNLPVNVRVRANVSGNWTPYGPACRLMVIDEPSLAPGAQVRNGMAAGGAFSAWPNPNNGDRLNISLTGLDTEVHTAAITLHDATGRQVLSTTQSVDQGSLGTVLDLGNTVSGVYLVRVIAGGTIRESRVLVVND